MQRNSQCHTQGLCQQEQTWTCAPTHVPINIINIQCTVSQCGARGTCPTHSGVRSHRVSCIAHSPRNWKSQAIARLRIHLRHTNLFPEASIATNRKTYSSERKTKDSERTSVGIQSIHLRQHGIDSCYFDQLQTHLFTVVDNNYYKKKKENLSMLFATKHTETGHKRR